MQKYAKDRHWTKQARVLESGPLMTALTIQAVHRHRGGSSSPVRLCHELLPSFCIHENAVYFHFLEFMQQVIWTKLSRGSIQRPNDEKYVSI